MNETKHDKVGVVCRTLGFPSECSPAGPQILLIGREELQAKPCRALEKYTEAEICVRLSSGRLRIAGKNLQIRTFCGGILQLRGHIAILDLQNEGEVAE